jgi:three-Cys-motif partner protein
MPKLNFSNYEGGREQAYVKHSLLRDYLPELAYRIGRTWDSLAYIDGFAGPWRTQAQDHADSSFGVAIEALRRSQNGLRDTHGQELHVNCILVEKDNVAFAELERFAATETSSEFEVHALHGEFVTKIPFINQLAKGGDKNPFKFVLLDPTGWADIPMDKLQPLLSNRSCEVLINLMTRHIIRFLEQPDRESSFKGLFARPGVVEVLRDTPLDQRVERAVQEYSLSLKQLCNFKYVSSAIIMEPDQEAVRYYLVYATNHPRGVEVFKAAENKAAKLQDNVRQESRVKKAGGQLEFPSDNGPQPSRLIRALLLRNMRNARSGVLKVLRANTSAGGVAYADLFCEAMAFPLVTPNDLVKWLKALEPNVEIRLAGIPSRKKPRPSEDYRVFVMDSKALEQS